MASEETQLTLHGQTFSRGRFFAICGPCVIENSDLPLLVAEKLAGIAQRLDLPLIFKASFDKANRTSISSFRGPGLEQGLKVLARVRETSGLPLISDVHLPEQVPQAAQVLDVLQIPAFLCRQTDLLLAAGNSGLPVNVKKGQFLAPQDMGQVVGKLREAGCRHIWLTERGASFGYHNLVVDMRSIPLMASQGCPVIMDATHAVQLPGGLGNASGGDRRFVPTLAQAAVAAGADGVFLEVHPDPEQALCDGPNSLPLGELEGLLRKLKSIHTLVRGEA